MNKYPLARLAVATATSLALCATSLTPVWAMDVVFDTNIPQSISETVLSPSSIPTPALSVPVIEAKKSSEPPKTGGASDPRPHVFEGTAPVVSALHPRGRVVPVQRVTSPTPVPVTSESQVGYARGGAFSVPYSARTQAPMDFSPGDIEDQAPRRTSSRITISPDGGDMRQQTQQLLESLQVNAPARSGGGAGYTALPPTVRESLITLTRGDELSVNMSVGSAKSVRIPEPIDKAIVVLPDIVDVIVQTPTRVQVIAKAGGATDVAFTDKAGNTYKIHVIVVVDVSPVQQALDLGMRGEHITATAVSGTIRLTGTVRDAATASAAVAIATRYVSGGAANVINQINITSGQQVQLRVRVAEVKRNLLKNLGVNAALDDGRNVVGNAPSASKFGLNGAAPTTGASSLTTEALATGLGNNAVAFLTKRTFAGVFTGVLAALETEGLVRTLAEPTLTAISGKTANMLAGEQYPIPTVNNNGNVGTEYRPFGVALSFTPTVLSPSSIGLDVSTEVSSLGASVSFPVGSGTTQVPIFNTRKANTSVELSSGGSIVIAGLLQSDFQHTMSGVPGALDMPILGKLLSSSSFQNDETELVIVVTAFIVEQTDANALALPTDGLMPPSDSDMYLMNRLTGAFDTKAKRMPPGMERNFGYITE